MLLQSGAMSSNDCYFTSLHLPRDTGIDMRAEACAALCKLLAHPLLPQGYSRRLAQALAKADEREVGIPILEKGQRDV